MLQAVEGRHQVLPVAGEGRPVPDRAGQRLRRQHLAHPDDPDRQGVRRDAGDQGGRQGVQGRLDRHRRGGAARRDRGLHQPGLRRDRHHRRQPEGFDRVIRLANQNGVVLVPFDNVLDTDEVMMVNEDQHAMGVMGRCWQEHRRAHRQGARGARRARQLGRPRSPCRLPRGHGEAKRTNFEIVEVVGNWDDGTSQKAPPTRMAVHGKFDASSPRAARPARSARSSTPAIPMVPMAGEGENGFRKLCAEIQGQGPQGLVLRPVAGAGRDLDQGGDRGARGQPDAAVDLGADPATPTTRHSRTARTTSPT